MGYGDAFNGINFAGDGNYAYPVAQTLSPQQTTPNSSMQALLQGLQNGGVDPTTFGMLLQAIQQGQGNQIQQSQLQNQYNLGNTALANQLNLGQQQIGLGKTALGNQTSLINDMFGASGPFGSNGVLGKLVGGIGNLFGNGGVSGVLGGLFGGGAGGAGGGGAPGGLVNGAQQAVQGLGAPVLTGFQGPNGIGAQLNFGGSPAGQGNGWAGGPMRPTGSPANGFSFSNMGGPGGQPMGREQAIAANRNFLPKSQQPMYDMASGSGYQPYA